MRNEKRKEKKKKKKEADCWVVFMNDTYPMYKHDKSGVQFVLVCFNACIIQRHVNEPMTDFVSITSI